MKFSYFLTLLFLSTVFAFLPNTKISYLAFSQIDEWSINKQKVNFKEKRIIKPHEEEVIINRKKKILNSARDTTIYIQSTIKNDNILSGFIAAKKGNLYIAITSKKVLAEKDSYVIVKEKIKFPIIDMNPLPQTDLAIVIFESKKKFKIATLGDNTEIQNNDLVYIAGYTIPGLNIQHPILSVSEGKITKAFLDFEQNGNLLEISNTTSKGMNGGPIYNQNGQVISTNKFIDNKGKSHGISNRQFKKFIYDSGEQKYSNFKFRFAKPHLK